MTRGLIAIQEMEGNVCPTLPRLRKMAWNFVFLAFVYFLLINLRVV